jgi:hypothetical protein
LNPLSIKCILEVRTTVVADALHLEGLQDTSLLLLPMKLNWICQFRVNAATLQTVDRQQYKVPAIAFNQFPEELIQIVDPPELRVNANKCVELPIVSLQGAKDTVGTSFDVGVTFLCQWVVVVENHTSANAFRHLRVSFVAN